MSTTVFITGADGEIGHGLIQHLSDQDNIKIIALDLHPFDPEIEKDFERARHLEPNLTSVPFEEAGVWLAAGQRDALGLRRSVGRDGDRVERRRRRPGRRTP